MASQFLVHIFKKWLSRLARRSVSVLFSFLSLLRRLAAGYSGLRDRGTIIRSHFSPRSQGYVAGDDILVYPSHLPLDQTSLEVEKGRSSLSDVPYSGQGSDIPSARSNPFSASSVSSLHPPRHAGESHFTSPRNRYDQKGKDIDSSERVGGKSSLETGCDIHYRPPPVRAHQSLKDHP